MLTAEPKRYGFSKSKPHAWQSAVSTFALQWNCPKLTGTLLRTCLRTVFTVLPAFCLNTALEHYGLISETVYTVTSCQLLKRKKKKKYETVFGTFTYRNVPSEAFPLGIRLIQEGSRICGYNGAKHRTSAFFKMRYAVLCSTHLICCILRQ